VEGKTLRLLNGKKPSKSRKSGALTCSVDIVVEGGPLVFRVGLQVLIACDIRKIKDLDICPRKGYSSSNSHIIQSRSKLSSQP